MDLVVPINVQALRVTREDGSLITGNLAGPSTSFDRLPWRNKKAEYRPVSSKQEANVADRITRSLSKDSLEALEPGVHLHWALPDALARAVQGDEGKLVFPAAPNRWLVTRTIVFESGEIRTAQWIVESDALMTEAEYTGDGSYFDRTRRKCTAVPVGWDVADGFDFDTFANYQPPFRRLGRTFELEEWKRHLDDPTASSMPEFQLSDKSLMPNRRLGHLSAVGFTGPTFAAYYPDCKSSFGFHDTFRDLGDVLSDDLDGMKFSVSYQVSGWHSSPDDDPLQCAAFRKQLQSASDANSERLGELKLSEELLLANTVWDRYRWFYSPGTAPERCVYGGQVTGLPWDTTGENPDVDGEMTSSLPKCYLVPPRKDDTTRVAVGNSSAEALAALIKDEWARRTESDFGEAAGGKPPMPAGIEHNLEFLLNALQLGLLNDIGPGLSLAELEAAGHEQGFGSAGGGTAWQIRRAHEPGEGSLTESPQATLPEDATDLADRLNLLNVFQQRLDALIAVIVTTQRQVFLDWFRYLTALFVDSDEQQIDPSTLKRYISQEVLDLWAKVEAAVGKQLDGSARPDHLPIFFRGEISIDDMGRYATDSPSASLTGTIVEQANALSDLLAADFPLFDLVQVAAPRFWEPQDLVMVISADSLRPARRNGFAKYLACRVSSELVTAVRSAGGSVGARDVTNLGERNDVEATSNESPSMFDATVLHLLDGVKAEEGTATAPLMRSVVGLIAESRLLDPSLLAATIGGPADAEVRTEAEASVSAIHKAWREGVPTNANTSWEPGVPLDPDHPPPIPTILADERLSGVPPQGLAVTWQAPAEWKDPFLPLQLIWTAAFKPFVGAATTEYEPQAVTSRFLLDQNAIDFAENTDQRPAVSEGEIRLEGTIPVSSTAALPLLGQIQRYLEDHPDANPQLKKLTDHFKEKPLLSQALGGLNDALLGRRQGLQMSPFNPFYDLEGSATQLGAEQKTGPYRNCLTHFVAAATAGQTELQPGEDYRPLRTGYLDIQKIELIDVFGRRLAVLDKDDASSAVVPSWRLKANAKEVPAGAAVPQMYLAPRIAQPTRLRFRWLSAEDDRVELNDHPSTSPICGWVLPNHLDNSLMLFHRDGTPLGACGAYGGQTTVTARPVPGHMPSQFDDDLQHTNPHFKKFIEFLLGKDRSFFGALMKSIDRSQGYILPGDRRSADSHAVLMGNPLALTRAALRLETFGLPAADASSASLMKSLSGPDVDNPHDWKHRRYDWTTRNYDQLRRVDFPIRLGDLDHIEDGLVGYFIDSDAEAGTLFAPGFEQADQPGLRQPNETVSPLRLNLHAAIDPPAKPYSNAEAQIEDLLDSDRPREYTSVTMLVDPRAKVHATSGILPVKKIGLPPDQFADALEKIEITFFTSPILRPADGLAVPISEEAGFEWFYTTAEKTDGSSTPEDEALLPNPIGDRAWFGFSPQIIEEGWLKLKLRTEEEAGNE